MEYQILFIIGFLLLSAFFSGMEIAFVSANRIRLELDKNDKGTNARILHKLTEKPGDFITTMLVGNNIALVIYGFFMGDLITEIIQKHYPYIQGFNELFIKTIVSTLVILFTAEFFPKAIFQLYANKLLKFFAFPAYIIYLIFRPITRFILWISNFFLKYIFHTTSDEVQQAISKFELGKFISEHLKTKQQNSDSYNELKILNNALDFVDVKAREIMIPRIEIIAMDENSNINELKKKFIETGLSKIIIYNDNIDNITGYVHSFDLFKNPKNIRSILREVLFVPETIPINELLNEMTRKKKNIAVVLDEYGGTSGLITLEDIIEEIFGEIEDEHDKNELFEKKIDDNTFVLSGRHEIEDLNEKYNLEIPESESYETLSGYILENIGEIPTEGDEFDIDHFHIKINKTNPNQIIKVILKKKND